MVCWREKGTSNKVTKAELQSLPKLTHLHCPCRGDRRFVVVVVVGLIQNY